MKQLLWIFIVLIVAGKLFANPTIETKIVGGSDADIRNYPYQISLQYYGSHICGGSIISSNYILTAAHCTVGKAASSLSVQAGSSHRNQGGHVINVAEVHQHSQYSSLKQDYDVCVLKLGTDLILNAQVQAIKLSDSRPSTGIIATVTGWGNLKETGPSPKQLQVVNVTIIDQIACKKSYNGAITDRMICAGAEGKDSCQGDSGGPMSVNGMLVGIVSWGYGCARPEYPGAYASVPILRGFIYNISGV